mgnify:CR=1 FL=1
MIGAFGAHALKATLTAHDRLDTFETAVKYQFYHALALVLLGIFLSFPGHTHRAYAYAGYCFVAGIVVFSGSLYALCLTNVRWLGAVTPLGGVALIAGWALLFWAFQ